MKSADEYHRQFAWRDWGTLLAALPDLDGQLVLDLGCGVGDLTAQLVKRGAHVFGVDLNEELIAVARSRNIPGAEFRSLDLRDLTSLGVQADGIWASFAAAYFTDLSAVLSDWSASLKPGGWIALTEIDDLFAHRPLSDDTHELFERYVAGALGAGRHDFRMGRKMPAHLARAGFALSASLTVKDQELSFDGPATPDVIEAWHSRFERLALLREMAGPRHEDAVREFLACLAREDHVSDCRVCFCVARLKTGQPWCRWAPGRRSP